MQQIGRDNKLFHEETDTFELGVTLQDNKLTITLKDYIDWIIYFKQYTEDDIGKEIHRKMDLVDVCNAFIQAKACNDKVYQQMEQSQATGTEIKKYEFGAIIANDNLPCYKIEKQGIVTAYLNVMDPKTKNLMIYGSKLVLAKFRNFTELEIETIKQKNEKFQKLNKKIQKQKREKVMLQKKILILEEKEGRLRDQLSQLKENFGLLKADLSSKLQNLQTNFDLMKEQQLEELQSINTQLKQKKQDVVAETKKTIKSQLSLLKINLEQISSYNERIKRFQQKLTQTNQQLSVQAQRSLDKFSEIQKMMQAIKLTLTLPQAYSSCFKINGLKLQYINSNNYTHFIFNQPIFFNQSSKFKLKITKTQKGHILIGIVDYIKQKDQRSSYSSGNAMSYYGFDGRKFPQNVGEGHVYKQGDIVEVEVNRATSSVKYSVNGKVQATQFNNMLADISRVFMPYLEMYLTNDTMEWLLMD